MTFDELKAELAARGFDDLSDTRLGYYVNRARAWLDDYAYWPYRETSVTGEPAPLIIADLGVVEAVLDMDLQVPLRPSTYLGLLYSYSDLSTEGLPVYWYLAQPDGGDPEIATYPVGSNSTIGVQYWRVTPELSLDADTPLAPSRYHQLIVDLAVQFAYRDTDNHQGADALQVQVDRDLGVMVQALMVGQAQGPNKFVRTSGRNF